MSDNEIKHSCFLHLSAKCDLFEKNINLNFFSDSPLFHEDFANSILDKKRLFYKLDTIARYLNNELEADYDFDGYRTPLSMITEEPLDQDVIDVCFKLGANPNYIPTEDFTDVYPSLIFCVEDFETAKMFIEAGADITIVNSQGKTPLKFLEDSGVLTKKQTTELESHTYSA